MGGPVAVRQALLLIAHGSRYDEANDDLRWLAAGLAQHGGYEAIEPAFLELAEPTIEQAGERCVERGAERVLMVPYFLSAGLHVREDLRAARDELSRRHPQVEFLLCEPLGRDERLIDVALARIREADR